MNRWWVIHEPQMLDMLGRVAAGESVDLVMVEFLANTDTETVETQAVEMVKGGFDSESEAREWAESRGAEVVRVDRYLGSWFVNYRYEDDR